MSTREFIESWTLKEDVVYTVETVQRLYDDALGYCYRITVVDPDESTYYMIIDQEYADAVALHDKLEKNRKEGINKKFTFTKTEIQIKPDVYRHCLKIEGESDVIELE